MPREKRKALAQNFNRYYNHLNGKFSWTSNKKSNFGITKSSWANKEVIQFAELSVYMI